MLYKKYLTFIPGEHKSFLQLSWLDKFAINAITNLFVPERLIPDAYLEPSQTSRMELFASLVYG